MNWQSYIATGILESYVLGELSASEAAEVQAMVDQHPEVKTELDRIERQFEEMSMASAIEPQLKFEDILSNIEPNPSSESTPSKPLTIVKEETSSENHIIVGRLRTAQRLSIAAGVAALIFGGLALNYFVKYQDISNDLTNVLAQQQELADNFNVVKQQSDQLSEELNLVKNGDFELIPLNGTDNAPEALAFIYWDRKSTELKMSIQSLQALSQNQQYQLWSIVDGIPVSQGVFDGTEKGIIDVQAASGNVAAFAVTIEPRGGSESPTLSSMQVYGEPSKS